MDVPAGFLHSLASVRAATEIRVAARHTLQNLSESAADTLAFELRYPLVYGF